MNKQFEEALMAFGKKHENFVVLHMDNSAALGVRLFSEAFSERTFNFGLAEAAMVGAAAGFAIRGKLPFVFGRVEMLFGRAFEDIKNLICEPNLNVKFVLSGDSGAYAGMIGGMENLKKYAVNEDSPTALLQKLYLGYGPEVIL